MNTITDLTFTTIESKGFTFSLTMDDLAMIQSKVPVKEELRPFIGIYDVMRFCQSPQGIPIALLQAGRKFKADLSIAELQSAMSTLQQMEAVGALMSKCMGVSSEDTSEEGEPVIPLAVKSETGS